ncbi:hypothetical protein MMC31_007113, partial [Peltigera leucophlebia]|nr:hypothetical protein [Peltigera leucophlebia]
SHDVISKPKRMAEELVPEELAPELALKELAPEELVSAKLVSEELVPEKSSKDGGASEENGGHCSKLRLPNVLERSLVKPLLGPKERVSERCSKGLVSEESLKKGGAY